MTTYLFERKFYKTKARRADDIEVLRGIGIERVSQLLDEKLTDPLTKWIWIEDETNVRA